MSCGRAQEFLARNKVSVGERVSAGQARLGRADALKLVAGASKIIVAKGKKTRTFDLRKNPPGDDELLKAMLGPTGKLRAPTIRRGKLLLVGFSPEVYQAIL